MSRSLKVSLFIDCSEFIEDMKLSVLALVIWFGLAWTEDIKAYWKGD